MLVHYIQIVYFVLVVTSIAASVIPMGTLPSIYSMTIIQMGPKYKPPALMLP